MWETQISFSSFMDAVRHGKLIENIVIVFVPRTEEDFSLSSEMVRQVQEMDNILGASIALITLSAPKQSFFTVKNFPWELLDGKKRRGTFQRVSEIRRTDSKFPQDGLLEFEKQLKNFFRIETEGSCMYMMFKGIEAVESVPVSGMTIERLKSFLRAVSARSKTYTSFPRDIEFIRTAHRIAINYLPLRNRAAEKKKQVEIALQTAVQKSEISVSIEEIRRISDVRLNPKSSIDLLHEVQNSGRLHDAFVLQRIIKAIETAAKAELERDLFLRRNSLIDLHNETVQKRAQLRAFLASLAALGLTASTDITSAPVERQGPSLMIGDNIIRINEVAQLVSDTLELIEQLMNIGGV